jgi:lysophospholipid acyltransferase (LPLAT)-like uncharacterized protein
MFRMIKYFLMLRILPPLVYLFLTMLRITFRVRHLNAEPIRQRWNRGENVIVCFWHGRLLMMPFANQRGKGKVLISRHRDGEFIARVVRFFRLGAVRGSYRKSGVSSVREIISDLAKGFDIAITPDGPKGPRYKVKQGIIELAKLTGKAIVPVTYGASKKKPFTPGTDLFFLIPSRRYCLSGEILSL